MEQRAEIRIYIVDEYEVVRRGIASLLTESADLVIVGEAGTYADALPQIRDLRPDVLIFDAALPDRSGVDMFREIHADEPDIKGLVVTAHDDAASISAAIMAGVTGYVLKHIDGKSLVSGVRLVAAGHSLIDPTVASRVLEQMEQQKRSLDVIRELTPQQRRIFFLIAEGLTNRQISDRLFLAEKTVKNHVTGLLARLGLSHRTQAALLAVRINESQSEKRPANPQPMAVPAPRIAYASGNRAG